MSAQADSARGSRCRWRAAFGASAAAFAMLAAGPVIGDSKDGIFPTADQVGGEVFPKGMQEGDSFPTDWEMYDDQGNKVDVGELISGKRSVLAFFISAVPVSVDELKKLQEASGNTDKDAQLLFINADTVGTALTGGADRKLRETIHTIDVIKREEGIKEPMFVAPNDALSPTGLSNKLGFRGLPTVFVVDADGKVEKVYVGPQDWAKTNI